jgi:hypothetical protein
MFVLFVENAKSFSLESFIACALSDCAWFVIESVMVDISFWCRSVALKSIPMLVQTNVLGLLDVVRIYLISLDLRNMVVLGHWVIGVANESDGCDCNI